MGKSIVVRMVEREAGKKLLGAAAFNPIVVKDGAIIGAIPGQIPEGAVETDLTYMHGIASQVAWQTERAIEEGLDKVEVRVPVVKKLSHINLTLDEAIRRYIESRKKPIDVRGPLFVHVIVDIL
jgi:O-phosphoseryl-tRNA(Cys) synthetase